MSNVLNTMTEKELQTTIVQAARLAGWLVYHTFDSRKSQPGFPDLVMARGEALLAWELKSARGKVAATQREWLDAFAATGVEARVIRPEDLDEALARLNTPMDWR